MTDSEITKPFPKGEVPEQISEIADDPVELVWINGVGGTTARVASVKGLPSSSYYVKWNPWSTGLSLATEVEKLRWLSSMGHPTSKVVAFEKQHDGELLITHDDVATSAVFPEWVDKPELAIRAIATGLKELHSLPVEECPYSWSVEERLQREVADVKKRKELLSQAPPIDKLVICHGDACAPNTLIDASGKFAGTIDVEHLGLADPWADLAVAVMSLEWNYPQYDEAVFWETYGVDPTTPKNQEYLRFYRDLWNAGE